jgi:hypothetical protein
VPMKTFIASKNLLSTAFAVTAFAVASLAPAFAQSRSHYGSPLPRYYNAEGEQIWGSWAPPTMAQQTTQPRSIYLYAKRHGSHAHVH